MILQPLIEQVKSETETKLKMLHEKELELNGWFGFKNRKFDISEKCVKSAETTMQQSEDKTGIMSKIDLLKKTESKDMKRDGVQLEVGIFVNVFPTFFCHIIIQL